MFDRFYCLVLRPLDFSKMDRSVVCCFLSFLFLVNWLIDVIVILLQSFFLIFYFFSFSFVDFLSEITY